jgi:hypothetical protein
MTLVIAFSAFAVPLSIGNNLAFAQGVTMETSADSHGNRFFGDALLRVEIEDDDADDDALDTIQVDIEVRDDSGTLLVDDTVTVDDTTDGSQLFEFFLRPEGSTIVPQDEDDDTPADTLFDVGDGSEIDLGAGEALADGYTIRITYEGQTKTIRYDDSSTAVSVDRENFGTGNTVFVTVTDQDGNMDPTNREVILASDVAGNFITITGDTSFEDAVCTETGDNTAAFECEWVLTTAATGDDDIIIPDNEVVSLVITARDASQYSLDDVVDGVIDENDAADVVLESGTDSETIAIEDVDGEIAQVSDPTFASELSLSLEDIDRNLNSKVEDDIIGDIVAGIDTTDSGEDACDFDPSALDDPGNFGLLVYVDIACGDVELIDLTESDDNTGTFVPDLSNDELELDFLSADDGAPTVSNGILEFNQTSIDADIVIVYLDGAPDDDADPLTSSFTRELARVTGTIDLPDSAGVNADFTVTLTEPDLNNDPRSRDSYTVQFDGTSTSTVANEFAFFRGGASLGDGDAADDALYATLEFEVEGEAADFDDLVTYTFTETGINTGIFTSSFDMAQIIDALVDAQDDIEDGDEFSITYHDYMEVPDDEDSDELTIGRADTAVDFSRDVVPIPPNPAGDIDDALGSDAVAVNLLITDADENDNSGSEDQITVDIGTNFEVEVDGENFNLVIDAPGETDDNFSGAADSSLDDILVDNFQGTVLTETGSNTGVFETTLEFVRATLTGGEWQDLTVTFTYIDAADESESDGVTFRGSDGSLQADLASVKPGDIITVTLQDNDLNLDDEEIDEFDATFDSDDLIFFEAEDDDITNAGTVETFTETEENSGVFTLEMEVGTDITVTDTAEEDQATNIHVEYNDETDSNGDDGDEIELDIPIVTATGGIRITPELVGPGTEITVTITDSDLNEDPDARDDLSEADVGDMVEFSTSRDEVADENEENPGLDETGPNTGVFEFTIQLVPGSADECADEDVPTAQSVSGNEAEMGACPGDFVSISYEDTTGAGGRSGVASALVEVSSWDPEFAADKETYSVGDRVAISISDPDANTDPDIADSLRDIQVTSDTDVVGDEFSALETGPDTGVFRLSFALTSGAGGGISVRNGDSVEIEYTDEFPADFVDEEEDKEFVFTIDVGGQGTSPTTTTPSAPVARDVQNRPVSEVTVGQQIVLSTQIVNNIGNDQPFVGLIEVRDDTGVTVFLSWQTGTLTPSGRTDVGISWTPEIAGDYEVRTFVISNLENPQILSPVARSEISVS